jgi:protein-S-isoprenylcysteine O-methyltransferase Ste14
MAERDLRQVAVYNAPEATAPTSTLISGIVSDVQDLVRKEISLARTETVEEIQKAKTAAIAFVSAGAVLAIGGLLLILALGQGIADLLNWPVWAGYGILGVLLAIAGLVLMAAGRRKAKTIHPIPEKTVETVKENVAWLKDRTTART